MQCPRCGAALTEYGGALRLCACGWRGESPRVGLRLLVMGAVLDAAGTLLLVYLLVQNLAGTPWIAAAVSLMVGGGVLIVTGAIKQKSRSKV
jgi:hypothetical protein